MKMHQSKLQRTFSDIELVEMFQKGDVEAFEKLYEKYAKTLYAFALKYLRSQDEAEDLIQNVFLKVWVNRENIKKELSFKSFLFTIAYNDFCKIFRKRKYIQKFIIYTLNNDRQFTSNTEEFIDYESVLYLLEQIISKLPERQKNIFIKSHFEDKSTKEIAEELNISTGTVDNYNSKTLKFIRSKLSIVR